MFSVILCNVFLCSVKRKSSLLTEILYFSVEGHPELLENASSDKGTRPDSMLKSKIKNYKL